MSLPEERFLVFLGRSAGVGGVQHLTKSYLHTGIFSEKVFVEDFGMSLLLKIFSLRSRATLFYVAPDTRLRILALFLIPRNKLVSIFDSDIFRIWPAKKFLSSVIEMAVFNKSKFKIRTLRSIYPNAGCVFLGLPAFINDPVVRRKAKGDVCRLVFFGRACFEKGADRLKKISRELDRLGFSHSLSVYGPGFEHFLNEGSVKFFGVSKKAFEKISGADFLILPSRIEGGPNVIREAIWCGTRVIASGCSPGVIELVGDCGAIVSAGVGELNSMGEEALIESFARAIEEAENYDDISPLLYEKLRRRLSFNFFSEELRVLNKDFEKRS